MSAQPDASDLLSAARDTLLEVILPQIPATARAHGEHVALALAIVLREIEVATNGRVIDPGLSQIYPEARAPDETTLQRLAGDIRNGQFDKPGTNRTALLNYLRQATAEQLAIDNPGYS